MSSFIGIFLVTAILWRNLLMSAEDEETWLGLKGDQDAWLDFGEADNPGNAAVFRRSVAQQKDPLPDSSEQEWIGEAIKDIAYYLRAHKFNEYDRRYEVNGSTAPRTYHRSHPRPPLRSLHWEVHKFCDESFLICIKYLWMRVQGAILRRADDTSIVMQEQHWDEKANHKQIAIVDAECKKLRDRDNLRADPFQGPLERFQWRTTASYFMCWYTMNEVKYLRHLGEHCDNFASCLNRKLGPRNQDPRANDSVPFRCAQYSFCPDLCCLERHLGKLSTCEKLEDSNPCFASAPEDFRQCTVNRRENVDLTASILNQWNVTCHCKRMGFEWDSSYGICVDVDECMTGEHNCSGSKGQACLNLPGSFKCVCKWGYIWVSEMDLCMHNRAVEPIKLAMLKQQLQISTAVQEKSYLRRFYKFLKQYFRSSASAIIIAYNRMALVSLAVNFHAYLKFH